MSQLPSYEYGSHSYPPLCEGLQDTSLFLKNDYQFPLIMQKYDPASQQWVSLGMLGPADHTSFWRPSGELWRLFDPMSGQPQSQGMTIRPRTELRAYPSAMPLEYSLPERHRLATSYRHQY